LWHIPSDRRWQSRRRLDAAYLEEVREGALILLYRLLFVCPRIGRPHSPRKGGSARGYDLKPLRLVEWGLTPEWSVLDNAHRIERTYRFKNFAEAYALVQKIAELAEAEGHHPDVSFGWGYVTVSLQTKKIKGLHENDFIMAAKIDEVASPQ
jgi:pterin-4a-carbinolamine dehydratase